MVTLHFAGLLAYLTLQLLLALGFNSYVLTPKELKRLVLSKATLSNLPSGTVDIFGLQWCIRGERVYLMRKYVDNIR